MIGLAHHLRGWALAMQGQSEAGMAQMRQGLAGILATGQALAQPFCLVRMAEAAGGTGHVDQGLHLLAEALAAFEAQRERRHADGGLSPSGGIPAAPSWFQTLSRPKRASSRL